MAIELHPLKPLYLLQIELFLLLLEFFRYILLLLVKFKGELRLLLEFAETHLFVEVG